jgi:hypothetical protein
MRRGRRTAASPRETRPSRTRTLRRALVAAAAVLAGALAAAPLAAAADEAAIKELEARYRKLAKNKDDAANRERRKLLFSLFDQRDLKGCRKLLREAYGEETLADNRIAVVQVLGATGDAKELDFLLGAFRKERLPGPQIALGQALSYTDPARAEAISSYAATLVARNKGDSGRSLLEGLGDLASPSAFPALKALGQKLTPPERFEQVIALGACGRAAAVPSLEALGTDPDAAVRLAVAIALGRTGGPEQPAAQDALTPLTSLLGDGDPRVVEAAALALAKTKHAPAVGPLTDALRRAPLRTREALRGALAALTGRECGHDADAWKAGGTAPAPKIPVFAGLPVPSDHVAIVVDVSRRMSWNGRLARATGVCSEYLATLPADASFGLVACSRTPTPASEKLLLGDAGRRDAEDWLRKLATAGGCDLKEALVYVVRTWPSVDTIVVVGASAPLGDNADASPLEVIQEFRRENRALRVRVFSAFVAPGGRSPQMETDEGEYAERKDLLQELAESTGGKAAVLE